jgi:uncharacterized protein
MPTEKVYISADQLLNDAFLLGKMVIDDGFYPDMLIALWRGGTPVAIAIQELLVYQGHPHLHFAIKTSHYAGIERRHDRVVVESMEPVRAALRDGMGVLVVDDVFDTGLSLDQVIMALSSSANDLDIRLATPYFKPTNNQTLRRPDYYLHATDQWIVFPHELIGLENAEILSGKPELVSLKEVLTTSRGN